MPVLKRGKYVTSFNQIVLLNIIYIPHFIEFSELEVQIIGMFPIWNAWLLDESIVMYIYAYFIQLRLI